MDMKPRIYAGVFGALATATLIEVGIANMTIARATLTSAILAFASFKGLLIAMYYMHLRYERRSVAAFAIPPVILLLLLLFAMSLG